MVSQSRLCAGFARHDSSQVSQADECASATKGENGQVRQHPKRASKRDSIEPSIVKALRDAGYLVTEGGWLCDLIVFDPVGAGRLHLLEVKSARGKLTPTQEGAIKQGWPVRVVRSVEQAFDALGQG